MIKINAKAIKKFFMSNFYSLFCYFLIFIFVVSHIHERIIEGCEKRERERIFFCEAYHMHDTAIYGLKTVNQMATSAIFIIDFVSARLFFLRFWHATILTWLTQFRWKNARIKNILLLKRIKKDWFWWICLK